MAEYQAQTTTECLTTWCSLKVGHKEPHNEAEKSALSERPRRLDPRAQGHTLHVCPGGHEDGGWSCMFCAGGLSACDTCHAFEGAWPDNCPGHRMDALTRELVYTGRINYRDGWWRVECAQAMRHIYDKTAYMAEWGYVPDGHGGWTHIEEMPNFHE